MNQGTWRGADQGQHTERAMEPHGTSQHKAIESQKRS
uniref:Uncharacterized protein n=1 Tax=Arundo donax TaxID=35708 RepID=A0A0A9CJ38_ARUDO